MPEVNSLVLWQKSRICIKFIPFQILLIHPDQHLNVGSFMVIVYWMVTIFFVSGTHGMLPMISVSRLLQSAICQRILK